MDKDISLYSMLTDTLIILPTEACQISGTEE
jgi:hypothetical protein